MFRDQTQAVNLNNRKEDNIFDMSFTKLINGYIKKSDPNVLLNL